MQSIRSRSWCFTVNNFTAADWFSVKAMCTPAAYGICEEEVGDKGTPHLQGYVRFPNAKTMQQMRKFVPRAHLEVAKGNDAQNRLYCSKSGTNVFEIGVVGEQGKRSDLATISKMIKNKEISFEDVMWTYPEQYARCHRAFKDMFNAVMTARTEAPEVTWLWGAAGVGKTRWAHDKFGQENIYSKDNTPWWDGYRQQQVIMIDDFEDDIPYRTLLKMIDRYQYQGQIKGGYVHINSPQMVITCEFPRHTFGQATSWRKLSAG